jgi:2-polyprenyl-6-methoxyphenol hydroxylase-like FAD-dependent oxidoreductase
MTRAPLPTHTDVLVVGAGPTGLALMTALVQQGVDVVAVDAAAGIRSESRAAGVQPRTLEDLARLGAADALVERGVRGVGFRAANRDDTLLEVSFEGLGTPFPYVLLVPQHVTEHVLQDTLESSGGHVFREHRVLDIAPEFDAVATLVSVPTARSAASGPVTSSVATGCTAVSGRAWASASPVRTGRRTMPSPTCDSMASTALRG